jgi:gluconolactonase
MNTRFSWRWSPIAAGLLAGAVLFSAGGRAEEKDAKTREVKIEEITLAVPGHWVQKPASNKLRLAQFDIPAAEGDEEASELVVYSFGGGGGGVDANIKRWIDQFQPKGRKVKLTSGKSPQGEYIFVDLSGTYNKPIGPPILNKTEPLANARMLAVILTIEQKGNYFLKLAGPEKTVSGESKSLRAAFGADETKEKEYAQEDAAEEN